MANHHEWPMSNRSRHICGTCPQKSLVLGKAVQPNGRLRAHPAVRLLERSVAAQTKQINS